MNSNLDPQLLSMLRCPVTKSALVPATEAELAAINEKIESGSAVDQLGKAVEEKIESGLVNEAKSLLLPVRSGIVVLVVDQAIRIEP